MSYVVQELVWEIGELKQALAEKDQEILSWRRVAERLELEKIEKDREIAALKAEFEIELPAREKAFVDDLQRRLRLGCQFTKTDCRRVLKSLRRKSHAYQQLMVEAEFLAKAIIACLPDGLPPVTRAQAFLKEREQ